MRWCQHRCGGTLLILVPTDCGAIWVGISSCLQEELFFCVCVTLCMCVCVCVCARARRGRVVSSPIWPRAYPLKSNTTVLESPIKEPWHPASFHCSDAINHECNTRQTHPVRHLQPGSLGSNSLTHKNHNNQITPRLHSSQALTSKKTKTKHPSHRRFDLWKDVWIFSKILTNFSSASGIRSAGVVFADSLQMMESDLYFPLFIQTCTPLKYFCMSVP